MKDITIGQVIEVDDSSATRNSVQSGFFTEWKPLMDNSNVGEWTVLEVDSNDVSKATNRYTTRATRLNAYDYTSGYEFKAIRRTPNALFLGKRV